MSYYKTNAIYEKIIQNHLNRFHFVSQNAWILVYANHLSEPKIIVLAHNKKWQADEKILELTNRIAQEAKLPLIRVCFDSEASSIDSMLVAMNNLPEKTLNLNEMKELYSSYGLNIKNNIANKAVNSQTSSAYHDWQRSSLGSDIVVSDIDLIKEKSKQLLVILELKRSYIGLDEWVPYREDFANFRVLDNLCKLSGNKFFILYNQRRTTPFFDDASRLTVFTFNNGDPLKIGQYNFKDLFIDS
ncbi:hypothetical protein [Neisseria montereyensis]|uniref:Uncharacterized protein n=1 Tax=Neisseria montereyensis TaxID=2973938 RepID=A0ABT2FC54_9NEIS|nr:hypothetical protein [Neisseria montereyensis]MCS4533540.1 hypothetical protein [Neisseria montereyensis]